MFSLAFLIGIYSYLIFGLGISGLLYPKIILTATVCYLIFAFIFLFKTENLKRIKKVSIDKDNKLINFLIALVLAQLFINLIGAIGPEIGFDALWYHLTLPKFFLTFHSVFHIPGGVFYYSDFPKLGEMLYTSSLAVFNEIFAKFLHFSFGILCCVVIYKIARKYLSEKYSLIAVLVFYSSLVVSWESISAYIDLIRTFFELMGIWGFLNWFETKKTKWLIESGIMIGFSLSTKLTGPVSIFVLCLFIAILLHRKGVRAMLRSELIFITSSIIVPFPYFVFSFLSTGNPVYPFFTNIYPIKYLAFQVSVVNFFKDILTFFTRSQDPISPVYLIFLPLLFIYFKRLKPEIKILFGYSLMSIILVEAFLIGDKTRFSLPYLPALSIVIAFLISKLENRKLKSVSVAIVILVAFLSIGYRSIANFKFIPVIFGQETTQKFLSEHLNFNYGDFYDTDNFFLKKITQNDRVLLFGFHNLYYVNFPFIDSSYVKKGDEFNYIATQNINLPERFRFWKLIYANHLTNVNVYSLGGLKWYY